MLGLAQAWAMRHEVISDGISYVEIASNYANGHWANAVNAYWSPLFSWLTAICLWLFRIPPYWEIATLHLVIFAAYIATIATFELLMRELLLSQKGPGEENTLPSSAIWTVGFCMILFAGLSMVGMWFCSPDMIALALTLFLYAVILRIRRTGGGFQMYALFGVLCALLYLDRAAFSALILICLAVVLISLWQQDRPLLKPLAVMAGVTVILIAPFVIAISLKDHHFTLGNAAKLNYAWELDGAHRWVHWQGEPGDIGKPLHPTHLVINSPKTFTFAEPINASYAPWYDPSYWYDGVAPKLKLKQQLRVIAVNISIALNLLIRSPIFLPALLLALLTGFIGWCKRLLGLWPVLFPAIAGLGLYTLVYVERRYVAANLLVIWIAMLVTLRLGNSTIRRVASGVLMIVALAFVGLYVRSRVLWAVKDGLSDLHHRQEKLQNVNYLLAAHLQALGLCPGDKVAYIGPGMNAEWARLARVRIVAEVPLMYARSAAFMNNLHVDDPTEIEHFFKGGPEVQKRVLDVFRGAGARLAVADGYFSYGMSDSWSRVIPLTEPHVQPFDKNVWSQVNSRYLWLDSPQTSSCSADSNKAAQLLH